MPANIYSKLQLRNWLVHVVMCAAGVYVASVHSQLLHIEKHAAGQAGMLECCSNAALQVIYLPDRISNGLTTM